MFIFIYFSIYLFIYLFILIVVVVTILQGSFYQNLPEFPIKPNIPYLKLDMFYIEC